MRYGLALPGRRRLLGVAACRFARACALDGGQLGRRVRDCRFVIDQGLRRAELARPIDPERIAAAGHSAGALTAQALSGHYRGSVPQFHDSRIRAAIALSPGAVSAAAAKSASGITFAFLCIPVFQTATWILTMAATACGSVCRSIIVLPSIDHWREVVSIYCC